MDMALTPEKVERLRTAVFDKTRMKIAADDPVFAIAAMHEEVLGEATDRLITASEKLRGDFKTYAEGEARRTKDEIKDAAVLAIRDHLAEEVNRAVVVALTSSKKQLAAFIVGVVVLSVAASSAFTFWLLK